MNKESRLLGLDKPSDLGGYSLIISIKSKSQENIDFVVKRYNDKIKKIEKIRIKLEKSIKKDNA